MISVFIDQILAKLKRKAAIKYFIFTKVIAIQKLQSIKLWHNVLYEQLLNCIGIAKTCRYVTQNLTKLLWRRFFEFENVF